MTEPRSARAQRYVLGLAVRYRPEGSAEWYTGSTRDMSESGVLLAADYLPSLGVALEMRIELPVAMSGQAPAEVVCHGRVVRALAGATSDRMPTIAVAFSDYRFERIGSSSEVEEGQKKARHGTH